MSTPTKPERVEVGPMAAKANGRPPGCLFCGSESLTNYNDWACEPCIIRESISSLADAKIAWDRGARDFPRPAPATPGTATVTKAAVWESNGCDCGHAGCRTCDPHKPSCSCGPCARDRAASKPPASPVGPPASCLMEQWDGATVTPRTALEAIQAKREPEPWVESCDLLHWLRDA